MGKMDYFQFQFAICLFWHSFGYQLPHNPEDGDSTEKGFLLEKCPKGSFFGRHRLMPWHLNGFRLVASNSGNSPLILAHFLQTPLAVLEKGGGGENDGKMIGGN
jgi:hypothetical protein